MLIGSTNTQIRFVKHPSSSSSIRFLEVMSSVVHTTSPKRLYVGYRLFHVEIISG